MDSIESMKSYVTRNIEIIEASSSMSSEIKHQLMEQDLDSFFSSDALYQSTFPAKSIAVTDQSPRDSSIGSLSPSAIADAQLRRPLREIRICERFELDASDRETISLKDLLAALEPNT